MAKPKKNNKINWQTYLVILIYTLVSLGQIFLLPRNTVQNIKENSPQNILLKRKEPSITNVLLLLKRLDKGTLNERFGFKGLSFPLETSLILNIPYIESSQLKKPSYLQFSRIFTNQKISYLNLCTFRI